METNKGRASETGKGTWKERAFDEATQAIDRGVTIFSGIPTITQQSDTNLNDHESVKTPAELLYNKMIFADNYEAGLQNSQTEDMRRSRRQAEDFQDKNAKN